MDVIGAAGVGKTYQMLEDAHDLSARGVDVVIGFLEAHGRKDVLELAAGLERIPLRRVAYRGGAAEEMDTDAIRNRHPRTCVSDELAHTNVPGSTRQKRWEDVQTLLDDGIDVLTTMNVQNLASLSDQVWEITGLRVRETVPDWVFQESDEVVLVDVTPRALLHRLERGVVYGREKAQHALQNFFRESSLVALRELTMREAAHEVEHRIGGVDRDRIAIEQLPYPAEGARHKILVVVTTDPKTAMVIRRARRVSDFLGAECFAVAVQLSGDLSGAPEGEREALLAPQTTQIKLRTLTSSVLPWVVPSRPSSVPGTRSPDL